MFPIFILLKKTNCYTSGRFDYSSLINKQQKHFFFKGRLYCWFVYITIMLVSVGPRLVMMRRQNHLQTRIWKCSRFGLMRRSQLHTKPGKPFQHPLGSPENMEQIKPKSSNFFMDILHEILFYSPMSTLIGVTIGGLGATFCGALYFLHTSERLDVVSFGILQELVLTYHLFFFLIHVLAVSQCSNRAVFSEVPIESRSKFAIEVVTLKHLVMKRLLLPMRHRLLPRERSEILLPIAIHCFPHLLFWNFHFQ